MMNQTKGSVENEWTGTLITLKKIDLIVEMNLLTGR